MQVEFHQVESFFLFKVLYKVLVPMNTISTGQLWNKSGELCWYVNGTGQQAFHRLVLATGSLAIRWTSTGPSPATLYGPIMALFWSIDGNWLKACETSMQRKIFASIRVILSKKTIHQFNH